MRKTTTAGSMTKRARGFRDAIAAPGTRESSGTDKMRCPYCVAAYGNGGRAQPERAHYEKLFADGYQGDYIKLDPEHWILNGERFDRMPMIHKTAKGRYLRYGRPNPNAVHVLPVYETGHGPGDPFEYVKVIDVPGCSYCGGFGYVEISFTLKVRGQTTGVVEEMALPLAS